MSTWYPRKRDQPKQRQLLQSKVGCVLRVPPENMNHNAEFSLAQQTSYYSDRFPIPNKFIFDRMTPHGLAQTGRG